jgi:hypothetical protein
MPEAARAAVRASFAASRHLDDYVRAADARAETVAALRLAAESWRRIAEELGGGSAEAPWVQASWRCRAGHRVANAREVVRLRRAARWSTVSALRAAARLSGLSPLPAVRLHALVLEWQREHPAWTDALAPHVRYVDRLTAALGLARGPLLERAIAAHRLVTGES